MAHHHAGGEHGTLAPERAARVRRALALALGPVVLATLVGVVLLWPPPATPVGGDGNLLDRPGVRFQSAAVVAVVPVTCEDTISTDAPDACGDLVVRLDDGSQVSLVAPPALISAGIGPGARVHVVGLPGAAGEAIAYEFVDVDRTLHLTVLAAVFAGLVIAVARLRGLAALIGLVIAFGVLRAFMLPALLAGEPAIPVAVVGSALIMFVALYVAHGVSMRTTTAVIGTMFGLAATAVLGWAVTELAHLTGGGGDDERLLAAVAPDVQLRGVLLAGLVLAGLGVLNDVTVTQASAVWELHEAHPTRATARLFSSAMRIGRDHIASSVYTLVFAYAGAALPLFLLVTVYQDPLGLVVSSEGIAAEIASMLVGAIGLVLAVPLTTLTGALILRAAGPPVSPDRVTDDDAPPLGQTEGTDAVPPTVEVSPSPDLPLTRRALRAQRAAGSDQAEGPPGP